jgi:hypothetical protein
VGVCAADGEGVLPGPRTDYWALALIVSGFGTLGTAINVSGDGVVDALPGHDAAAHAAVCVADAGDQR